MATKSARERMGYWREGNVIVGRLEGEAFASVLYEDVDSMEADGISVKEVVRLLNQGVGPDWDSIEAALYAMVNEKRREPRGV